MGPSFEDTVSLEEPYILRSRRTAKVNFFKDSGIQESCYVQWFDFEEEIEVLGNLGESRSISDVTRLLSAQLDTSSSSCPTPYTY